jgi:cytochrome c-type biogenesis protein CcmH/NrfG
MIDEAKAAFRRVLDRDSTNVNATMFLSLIDFNDSKTNPSANQRKRALKDANAKVIESYKIDPRNAICALQMAERFFEKDLRKATVMSQASLLYSSSPRLKAEALIMLGRISHKQEDYSSAFESFKKAAELNPDSLTVQYSLAQLHIQKNDDDMAISCLEKVIEKHPNDYDTLKVSKY